MGLSDAFLLLNKLQHLLGGRRKKPWQDGYLGLLCPEDGCRDMTQIHMKVDIVNFAVCGAKCSSMFLSDECYLLISNKSQ